MLTDEDKYLCPICKKKQDATKKLQLYRLPEILVVQLKRWSGLDRPKICTDIQIPHQLTIPHELTVPGARGPYSTYTLYAVSNHIGPTVMSGHYTAHCNVQDNHGPNGWYSYNDRTTNKAKPEDISGVDACLLFYTRTITSTQTEPGNRTDGPFVIRTSPNQQMYRSEDDEKKTQAKNTKHKAPITTRYVRKRRTNTQPDLVRDLPTQTHDSVGQGPNMSGQGVKRKRTMEPVPVCPWGVDLQNQSWGTN